MSNRRIARSRIIGQSLGQYGFCGFGDHANGSGAISLLIRRKGHDEDRQGHENVRRVGQWSEFVFAHRSSPCSLVLVIIEARETAARNPVALVMGQAA